MNKELVNLCMVLGAVLLFMFVYNQYLTPQSPYQNEGELAMETEAEAEFRPVAEAVVPTHEEDAESVMSYDSEEEEVKGASAPTSMGTGPTDPQATDGLLPKHPYGGAWGAGETAKAGYDQAMVDQRTYGCFPRETLGAKDLLPQDSASTWAKVNPTGQGTLEGVNFLQAGHHIGINTVGQTLRNANQQLRSEPPNSTTAVSPWLQTTISPDLNRRSLEIGGCI